MISYIIFIIKHPWRKKSVKDEMKNHLKPSFMLFLPALFWEMAGTDPALVTCPGATRAALQSHTLAPSSSPPGLWSQGLYTLNTWARSAVFSSLISHLWREWIRMKASVSQCLLYTMGSVNVWWIRSTVITCYRGRLIPNRVLDPRWSEAWESKT